MSDGFDWVERDRGILTERDRKMLMGELDEELTQNAINQRRFNIRNRIENAIHDFHLLAVNLPRSDIRQLFEPAYEWSRQRRRLDDEGRTTAHPELTKLLRSWLALFEFYTYGMYAGGKRETQTLMCGLIQEGVERGFRQYQHENLQKYREISASLSIEYDHEILRNNYLRQVQSNLPNEPDELIEEVMALRQERKIPYSKANQWIGESGGTFNSE